MPCAAITEWMGDHLDGRLDAARVRDLEAHLATCEACRRDWEDLRQTVALIRALPPAAPPADLLQSVHQRLARQRHSRRVALWRVLNRPQTRVALAASCVILVGLTSVRWRPKNPADIEAVARRATRHASPGEATLERSLMEVLDAGRSLAAASQPDETDAPLADGAATLGLDIADTAAAGPESEITAAPAPPTSPIRPEGFAASAERDDVMWRADAANEMKADGGHPPAGLSIGGFAREKHERSPSGHVLREVASPAIEAQASADLATPLDVERHGSKDARKEPPGRRRDAPPDGSERVSEEREENALTGELKPEASAPRAPTPQSSRVREPESPRPIPRVIVLAGGNAATARQILDRFVVRANGKEGPEFKTVAGTEARAIEPADGDELLKRENVPDLPLSGWIQAVDYDRLLAALKAVGTPADDKRTEPSEEDNSRRGGAGELLFVTITLTPPAP